MARGKKKAAESGNLTHDNTRNELTDDQRQALTLQHKRKYEALLAAKKKADADLKNGCKLIKAELGDDGLADIKDMIAAASDENYEAKVQAELERKARLVRWLGLDIGTQGNLFGGPTAPASQHESAYAEGKLAGMAGEACKPPYGAGTDGYDGYMKGWHEGDAIRASLAREQEEGAAILERSPQNEPDGADAFDAAAEGEQTPWPDEVQAAENKVSEPEPA